MRNKKKNLLLAIDALFFAIIIIMTFTPLGFITIFGVVSNTLIHIPVLIGALLFGYKRGLMYGVFFGLCSLLKAAISPVGILDPYFVNPLVSILPRLLFGLLSGLIFDLLKKLPQKFSFPLIVVCSFMLTIMHTIMTLGILSLTYYSDINSLTSGAIIMFILGVLITNGVIEGVLALLVCPPVYISLRYFLNKKYKLDIK